ncbi:MAG: anthranilate synthase component I family protein [Lewinellaceae bacterium]|nr:anthranilate synthase component I family protein [Lewinellaceae bacterium]
MMRHVARFPIHDLALMKRRLLAWTDTYPIGACLDSNAQSEKSNQSWECLVAVGAADFFRANSGQAFAGLQAFYEQKKDWLFGFFGYDLKNEVEKLYSAHPDGIGLPDLYFFQPEIVVGIRPVELPPDGGFGGTARNGVAHLLEISSISMLPDAVFSAIQNTPVPKPATPAVTLMPRTAKQDYLATVEAIRQHIIAGDVYEMNLCQEFFAEKVQIEPQAVFVRLNERTRAPFAAFLRIEDRYLLCASPERFLQKKGTTVLSQPIKGTRRRHTDVQADARAREELRTSEKDRAENVMIVDLVRNDLSRNCLPGSVRVDELFGIYSFQTVHQMISTVSGTLRPGTHPIEALRDAFPMGSMTGAPKVMAMQLIEQYEQARRGLYSGAVGYFSPDGDFDFNVVIRSILYNAASGYLSCQVGGAIVYDSVPEQEYEECMVKIGALVASLGA